MSAFLCFTKNLILILDANQRIIQVNDQCQRALKRSKDDLIGLTLEEAALPVISSPDEIAVIKGLKREQIITDLRYQSDGKDLFYQMQAIPTTFKDGETGATLVLEDITERKKYVRNMEFLARTAMELVDMPPETDIYEYIAERVHELVPGSGVFAESYDEAGQSFILRAARERYLREGVSLMLGRDPIGIPFLVLEHFTAPQYEAVQTMFGLREYVLRPREKAGEYSFYDLCVSQIPE